MFTFCTGQRELKLSLPVKSSKLLFVAKLVDLIRAQLVTRGIMASKKASAQDSHSANSAAELLVRVLFKVVTHQQLGRDEKLVAEDAGKIGVDNLKVRKCFKTNNFCSSVMIYKINLKTVVIKYFNLKGRVPVVTTAKHRFQ